MRRFLETQEAGELRLIFEKLGASSRERLAQYIEAEKRIYRETECAALRADLESQTGSSSLSGRLKSTGTLSELQPAVSERTCFAED